MFPWFGSRIASPRPVIWFTWRSCVLMSLSRSLSTHIACRVRVLCITSAGILRRDCYCRSWPCCPALSCSLCESKAFRSQVFVFLSNANIYRRKRASSRIFPLYLNRSFVSLPLGACFLGQVKPDRVHTLRQEKGGGGISSACM